MTLLLIIISLIIFSLIPNYFNKKYSIFFILLSVIIVLLFYFFLAKFLFYNNQLFFPNKINYTYVPCGNYYNELTNSILQYKLNIFDKTHIPNDLLLNFNKTIQKFIFLTDTSIYKGKVYLYFGITPVLLFHLPFYLITNLYLTDKFITFILSCLCFIFSLLLIHNVTKNYKNIPLNIKILSIFLIGFCNLLPFLIVRSFIYQITVLTANVLLICAFYLFYYYINNKNLKTQYILIFFISLFLCLCVGARPHYFLFIPIFFFSIIFLKYKENKNIKYILKSILFFLIPCLIYGTIIAIYNFLRFDSIFEFGWKYQFNPHNQSNIIFTIKDFIIGFKNNFFLLPNMNEVTIFSLSKTFGHRIGNEYITGIIWTCPIILILFFIPNFLKQFYKKNFNFFIFFLTMILVIIINIIVSSFFGMVIRYIFEFLSLMIILSIIMFLFYQDNIENRLTKIFFNSTFILIFGFSMFINISLLFCRENFWNFVTLKNTNYTNIINFLF